MTVRGIVFGGRPGDRYRAGRTVRALRQAGVVAEDACPQPAAVLAKALAAAHDPVWLVRAGAWPVQIGPTHFPPPSATGQPVCALGLIQPNHEAGSLQEDAIQPWAAVQAETGGDFSLFLKDGRRFPPVASLYLEDEPVQLLARRLAEGEELAEAIQTLLGDGRFRVVHVSALDVHEDRAVRVVQVVTSLQRGGAERVTLDLAAELSRHGARCLLVALGKATREAFPAPPGTVELCHLGNRSTRLEALGSVVQRFAADLVHGHLLNREDAVCLSALGVPLVLTVHNMRPGWPQGLADLQRNEAALLIACSRAVESDLREVPLPLPVRTVWNGIDFSAYERTPERVAAGRELRERLGLKGDDLVLLALANPRPQKRLHLLPAILSVLRDELARRQVDREAKLVLVGETSRVNELGAQSVGAVQAEIARLDLQEHVHWTRSVEDVGPVLAAADVLVSTSAYEGLSLAHLEALAAGLPVVATDAGGTGELARDNPAIAVLPLDAGPEQCAAVLAELACRPPPSGRDRAAVHFTRWRMAERYSWFYPRAIEAGRGQRQGNGLWLVINNFSTGGAQSSARRFLLGLADMGVRVRAAVLEEEADHPTPGRRTLLAAGIPVLVLPSAATVDPKVAVTRLLEHFDADPPQAVLLWNAIAEHKILLADGLLDTPIFDISPGEMYFTSLERYFVRPRPGWPNRTPAEYGARLAGVIVKYQAEAARAAETLGTTVHVIPNGVPVTAQPVWRRPQGEQLVIGTLARINPQKKLEELLTALHRIHERMPPYVLRIAGGVERGCAAYAEQLRQQAVGLPVEWPGDVEDVSGFLQDLDLFALVAEPAGCPNASLEAMAAGLAVVATDVGGMAEQVEDGVSGRLVPRGDVEALAEALLELAWDRSGRKKCGSAGRERIVARFSLRRMLADYCRVCLGTSRLNK